MSKLKHLLDLAYELPGFEYNWVCAVCLLNAKSGILLEFQYRDPDHPLFVYVDSDDDQTPWVCCVHCRHKFHLSCITCFTISELHLAVDEFTCCHH